MTITSTVYDLLPERLQPMATRWYHRVHGRKPDERLHAEFVDYFFRSPSEYRAYVDEFERGPAVELRDEALRQYRRLTGSEGLGSVGLGTARDYYAIVRKRQPSTVVETGVCNGLSTLSILLALDENDAGQLYSIDYPHRADESLEAFRAETFEDYGGAAIPNDKEPGWIIPEELRTRWDLTLGKSQRELPLLLADTGPIDLFVHDSEHSHPCMMFEYELAYEWLVDGGVILSDDISWNRAFSVFVDTRRPDWGKLSNNVGYMVKHDDHR